MVHHLGAVRVPGCRPIRLASTQERQVRMKGLRSQEDIDQAMPARLRHHLRQLNRAHPTSMHLSQRRTVFEHHTTQRLQVFGRRALAGLQACATLRRTHISRVHLTREGRTRTLGVGSSAILTEVIRLRVNFLKCTLTRATSLRPKSSKGILRTGHEHNQERRNTHHLLPGIRMPLRLHPNKVHHHPEMYPTASRAGVRKAST